MEFGLNQFKEFITEYAQRLEELKSTLNELDNRIGDGDHGTNMARGFQVANQQLQAKNPTDIGTACNTVAMALLGNVGGASGPLYGTIFMKLASVFKEKLSVDDEMLLNGFLFAKNGIIERGKAQYGDKTMLDVWETATSFLQSNVGTNRYRDLMTVVQEAVLETRDRVAKKGRAAYLGPRSAGTCDPGSVSSGLFFEVFVRALDGEGAIIRWETLVL